MQTVEEKELLGSSWYICHPIVTLNKIITNLNVDMMGRMDTFPHPDHNYIYIIGSDRLISDLDRIIRKTNETFTKLELDERLNLRNAPFNCIFVRIIIILQSRGFQSRFYLAVLMSIIIKQVMK